MSPTVLALSLFDNAIRYLGTFIYQTSAPIDVVKTIYELTAISSLLVMVWFVSIPLAARAAFHRGHNPLILGLYRRTIFVLFLITFLALIVQQEVIIPGSFDSIFITANIFLIAWFGTALALLKARSKIVHLSILRAGSSTLFLGVMACGMLFGFNIFYILIGLMGSILIPSLAAEMLLGKIRGVSTTYQRFVQWMVKINLRYKGMIIQSAGFITIINIDRLIVSGTEDVQFVAEYAIATSICAPIIIVGNVLGLEYFTKFIKRHSTESFFSQVLTNACYAFAGVLLCLTLYFSLRTLQVFEDRMPSIEMVAVVSAYYYMYVIAQFLFFYSAVNAVGMKLNLTYMGIALLVYLSAPTSINALMFIFAIGVFVLILGSLAAYQTMRTPREQ